MRVQQNIWKSLRIQGRSIATKLSIGALLALLTVALVGSMSTLSQAHAETIESYTIVSGDTLSGIASRLGVSVSSLAAANGIASPNQIYAGQTIQIPGDSSSSSDVASIAYTGGGQGGSYQSMIYGIFGPYGSQAVHVAMCESSMNPDAYNGILGAAGLFQIIPGTWNKTSYAGQSPYSPAANIQAAYEIFAHDGYSWREWACRP